MEDKPLKIGTVGHVETGKSALRMAIAVLTEHTDLPIHQPCSNSFLTKDQQELVDAVRRREIPLIPTPKHKKHMYKPIQTGDKFVIIRWVCVCGKSL